MTGTFTEFSARWGTPAMLIAAVTIIYFVAQLDTVTDQNTAALGEVAQGQEIMRKELSELVVTLERTVTIQESIAKSLERTQRINDEIERRLDTHRQIIIENREKIRNQANSPPVGGGR